MENISVSTELFQCSVCCKALKNRLSFIAHMDNHQENTSVSEAEQTFYTEDGVYKLGELQTSALQVYIPKISLTKLEDIYTDKLILFSEKRRSHIPPQNAKFRDRRHQCHFCKVHLKRTETRSSHLPHCTSKPDFVCGICAISFPTAAPLAAHMRLRHLSAEHYACSFCPRRFVCLRGLKRHYRQTGCKKFMRGKNLGELMKMESSSQTSSSRDRVPKVRLRVQTAQKSFSCEFSCPAKFKTQEDLSLHTQIFHHVTPKFKCEFCEKPVSTLEGLSRHMSRTCLRKIESGKTPVSYRHQKRVCRHCKGSFTSKRALSEHVRNACQRKKTGTFICQHCDKCFMTARCLRRHCQYVCLPKLSEKSPLRHICDHCGASFAYKTSLLRHMSRQICGKNVGSLKIKREGESDTETASAIVKSEIIK